MTLTIPPHHLQQIARARPEHQCRAHLTAWCLALARELAPERERGVAAALCWLCRGGGEA